MPYHAKVYGPYHAKVYGMPVIPYRGYFVGLPWILHPARVPDATRPTKPVVSGAACHGP
jgi:hypothetical protein